MKTIVGMFETRDEAEDAIRRLMDAGFGSDSIGVALRDHHESADFSSSTGTHDLSGDGATAGVVSGGAVGTLIGIAMLGSHLILPGIGPMVVGGPIAAALTGAGIGAASGGLIGGLVGAGIPEDDAEHYSTLMEEGHILVSVQATDIQSVRARQILLQEGARVQ